MFLSVETKATPMHVGGLITLDTTNTPDFSFEKLRELFMRRMARVPKFTWTLVQAPLGLGRPLWRASDFDIDRHLQRLTVASPGGPHEIAEAIDTVMAEPLDRDAPLWRMWYLDGLPLGTAAIYANYHHCVMDGTSGASLGSLVLDLEPNPPSEAASPLVSPGGRNLSSLEQLARNGLELFTMPIKIGRFASGVARRVADLIPAVLKEGVPTPVWQRGPRASYNHVVGERRAMAFVSIPLDAAKDVRAKLGVTVNDVIVAVCTTALASYERSRGVPASTQPLAVAVPISLRAEGDVELTNHVSSLLASAPVNGDAVERVRDLARDIRRSKQISRSFTQPLPSVGELLPPAVLAAVTRMIWPLFSVMPVVMNTIVSTVKGAPIPLYVAGARVTGTYSTSVVLGNVGVNFTTLTSEDHIDIGITVDPDLVPDAWLIADAVPAALDELLGAAGLELSKAEPDHRPTAMTAAHE
jgi:diacylglycerol O-acyltransferase / wax synthase